MKRLLILFLISLPLSTQETAVIWDKYQKTENRTYAANTTNGFSYENTYTFRNILFVNDGTAPLKIYVNDFDFLFSVYSGEVFVWDRTPFSNFYVVNETTTNVPARCKVSGRFWRASDYR